MSSKTKQKPKMYVIKKYVKATSALQAIKLDRDTPVHDVWVDDAWAERGLAGAIGFDAPMDEEGSDE